MENLFFDARRDPKGWISRAAGLPIHKARAAAELVTSPPTVVGVAGDAVITAGLTYVSGFLGMLENPQLPTYVALGLRQGWTS